MNIKIIPTPFFCDDELVTELRPFYHTLLDLRNTDMDNYSAVIIDDPDVGRYLIENLIAVKISSKGTTKAFAKTNKGINLELLIKKIEALDIF